MKKKKGKMCLLKESEVKEDMENIFRFIKADIIFSTFEGFFFH